METINIRTLFARGAKRRLYRGSRRYHKDGWSMYSNELLNTEWLRRLDNDFRINQGMTNTKISEVGINTDYNLGKDE